MSLAQNKPLAVGLILACLGGAVGLYFLLSPDDPQPEPAVELVYYYDVNTKALFTASAKEWPPIDGPSGKPGPDGKPAGVRAHVFACGSCADEKNRFVGFLENLTPEAKAVVLRIKQGEAPPRADLEVWELGTFIRTPDQEAWTQRTDPAHAKVIEAIKAQCSGRGPLTDCFPPAEPAK